jgi:hypothetical protein
MALRQFRQQLFRRDQQRACRQPRVGVRPASFAAIDRVQQSTAYNVNDGGPEKSTDSGSTWSDITSNIPTDPTKNNQVQTFANTLDVDPNNGGFLYFGGASNQPTGSPLPTPVMPTP